MKPRARKFYCGLWTLTWQLEGIWKRTVTGLTLEQVWDKYTDWTERKSH